MGMNENETARQTAQRVVSRLLDGEAPKLETCTSAVGTPGKAWNQGKIPSKTSSSGAKSAMGNPSKAWHQGKIPSKTSSTGATSAMGTPGKAWKNGKAAGGEKVAKAPGNVSYRESLTKRVLENIKKKKAMKGLAKGSVSSIAKAPGKVSFGKR